MRSGVSCAVSRREVGVVVGRSYYLQHHVCEPARLRASIRVRLSLTAPHTWETGLRASVQVKWLGRENKLVARINYVTRTRHSVLLISSDMASCTSICMMCVCGRGACHVSAAACGTLQLRRLYAV